MITLSLSLISLLPLLNGVEAATAAEWRSRSIYQLVTDRFAHPNGPSAPCNTQDRAYCGGNYQAIIGQLDYIQEMGFDALWISPVSQNIEGTFHWGQPYHGFWTTDPTKLNPHFGSATDLQVLSSALHARGMLLMVDMAINHLASTTRDTSDASLASAAGGTLLFKKTENYHKFCGIDWGNRTSEQVCWLASGGNAPDDIMLMDLATESTEVADTLKDWVGPFVKEMGIDGFRMDATKHMSREFQGDFCRAAGVYCTGEVFGDNAAFAASYMGEGGIDAVLGFVLMYGLTRTLGGDQTHTMGTLRDYVNQLQAYPDATVTQTFLDNHDLPRFYASNPDKTRAQNAIVGNFLIAGIPTVYYGLEQEMNFGLDDPDNRDALWKYNSYSRDTPAYQLIKKLNEIRAGLGKSDTWHSSYGKVLKGAGGGDILTDQDIAIVRDGILIVLTRRGDGGSGSWTLKSNSFQSSQSVIDLLSCSKTTTGGDGSLEVTWTSGQPFVFATEERAAQAGLCGATPSTSTAVITPSSSDSASSPQSSTSSSVQTNVNVVDPTDSTSSSTATTSGTVVSTPTSSPSSNPAPTPGPGSAAGGNSGGQGQGQGSTPGGDGQGQPATGGSNPPPSESSSKACKRSRNRTRDLASGLVVVMAASLMLVV